MNSFVEYHPETKTYLNQKIKLPVFIYLFLFLAVLWCAGFMFPVYFPDFTGKPIVHQLLKYNYSLVCHQSEAATIHFNGNQLLVCARCAGIYSGATLILILFLIKSISNKLSWKQLFLFSAPLVLDALAVRLGIYDYSRVIAFISGVFLGVILIIFILDAIKNSIYPINKKI